MHAKPFKKLILFTMAGLFLLSACRQETTLTVRDKQEEQRWTPKISQESTFEKERLSRLLRTDLPETVRNLEYHAIGFHAHNVVHARFDIPRRDLVTLMEHSARLPSFSDLEQDNYSQFIHRQNLQQNSSLPWWDPVTLDKPLFTAVGGRMRGHPLGSASQLDPGSTWQLLFITSELTGKQLMRVYVKYKND